MHAKRNQTQEDRWGYAVAGTAAIGFAALIQFAFDDLPPAALVYLPVGKLALTVPLAALGGVLIARDLFANLGRRPAAVVQTQTEPATLDEQPQDVNFAPDEELDLETGEPLEEEMGPKIPALRGRFTWLLGDDSYDPAARRREV